MDTKKLILLRLYLTTFGRFPFFSKFLKKILIKTQIKNKKEDRYVASSRYFDIHDLEENDK